MQEKELVECHVPCRTKVESCYWKKKEIILNKAGNLEEHNGGRRASEKMGKFKGKKSRVIQKK